MIDIALQYHRSGNLSQAEEIYKKILANNPNDADALNLLGVLYHQLGNFESAVECIKKALQIDPGFSMAYNNLGNIIRDEGRLDEAMTYYSRALQIDPDLSIAHNNLGNIYLEKKQLDKAISSLRRAVDINPHFAEAYNNLGKAFFETGDFDQAMTYCQKAIRINPNYAEAYYNLGTILQERTQPDEAVDCFRKAIQIKPGFVNAHWNLSLSLLLSGNFREGWKEYEWRWQTEAFKPYVPKFTQPLWTGFDITEKIILLHVEQGFGDTIQFIRYASLVAQRCAKVIVRCQEELKRLFQNIEGVSQCTARGEQMPEFDVHCPLLSLPLAFDTTLENLPRRVPYVKADPRSVSKWKDKVNNDNSRLRVGLVWSGNPKKQKDYVRSFSPDIFLPLTQFSDIAFYSLQKGEAAEQAKNSLKSLNIIDYTEEIEDFSDTAALIENLDLVISVDTAVAHLTGALGRPVWTLLPFIPDWRWLLNRKDSPWYPSMRLFRQPIAGHWESVMAQVKDEIRLLDKN